MKKSITKFVAAVGLFAAGIIGLARTEDVSADTLRLQVVPSYIQIELKPGEVYHETFKVINSGDADITLDTSVSPYIQESDSDGNIKTFFDKESEYSEIVNWTTFDNTTLTIPKGDSVDVNFSIKVPSNAPGGGQYEYLSVTAKSEANNDAAFSIGQNASIGPVLYATVDGETHRTGKIHSNDIAGFLFNPPISVSALVENTGNVHTNAKQVLKVYPMFSNESIYNNEENPHEETLLPGVKRYIATNWNEAPSIGIYKVESEVRIFDQVSKVEKIVIICPMWVLVLIAVFILAVIFWIVSRVRARKAES